MEHARSERAASGKINASTAHSTRSEVQGAIDDFIVELNAILLPSYGVEVDTLTFDFDHYLRLRTRSSQRSAVATKPTPAWTGLRVRKREDCVQRGRNPRINQHGGGSSKISRKKQKKQKDAGLQRTSDYKHEI